MECKDVQSGTQDVCTSGMRSHQNRSLADLDGPDTTGCAGFAAPKKHSVAKETLIGKQQEFFDVQRRIPRPVQGNRPGGSRVGREHSRGRSAMVEG
jgi:hypothetical protein